MTLSGTARDTQNRIDFITLKAIAIEYNLPYYLHVSVLIINFNIIIFYRSKTLVFVYIYIFWKHPRLHLTAPNPPFANRLVKNYTYGVKL